LKAGDGAAGIALELLNAIGARHRHRVVAATRGTFEKLEGAVWLGPPASSRTPTGVSAPQIGLGDRHVAIAHAHQRATAVGTARRSHPLLFVHDRFTVDLPRRTGSGAATVCVCEPTLAFRRPRVSRRCGAAVIWSGARRGDAWTNFASRRFIVWSSTCIAPRPSRYGTTER
jgi:hypothetical protein